MLEKWNINENGMIDCDAFYLPAMGVCYLKVQNLAQGPDAPAIRFDLEPFADQKEIGIQAVIKYRNGLVEKCEEKREETWTSQGLSVETEEWLKNKNLEVRVFIDPKSKQIKWVKPQGPVSAKSAISKEFRIDCTRRKGQPPDTR